jgi:hypothetical protein
MSEDALGQKRFKKNRCAVGIEGSSHLWKFLKILEEMDRDGDLDRSDSGEIEGPFYSNALYSYNIKLGIEDEDLSPKRGFRPRLRYRRIDILSKR